MSHGRFASHTALAALIVLASGSELLALRPDGSSFPISTCSGCPAERPFLALEAGGGAVAWESGIISGLTARRLDAAGSPSGEVISLSFLDATSGPVDVAPNGTPWAAFGSAGALPNEVVFSEIAAARESFLIRGDAERPRVEPGGLIALGPRNVVATFEDLAADGISRQWIWRLAFPPGGGPHQISTTEGLARPRACPRPDGSVVVAWRTRAGDAYGVAYSIRDGNGETIRPETVLASNLTTDPRPALACARDGRFAFAWESSAHPGAIGSDIVVQRFDRRARRVPKREIANATLAGDQGAAAIAFDPGGSLLVAFQSVVANQQQIRARRFAANGAPEGTEARVDAGSAAVGDQGPAHPGVAPVGTAGKALVVWAEAGQILGRRLRR